MWHSRKRVWLEIRSYIVIKISIYLKSNWFRRGTIGHFIVLGLKHTQSRINVLIYLNLFIELFKKAIFRKCQVIVKRYFDIDWEQKILLSKKESKSLEVFFFKLLHQLLVFFVKLFFQDHESATGIAITNMTVAINSIDNDESVFFLVQSWVRYMAPV